jgi:hypothetical protein
MNTQQQMEERLWDYIDGLGSPTERSALEELIAANIEWQHTYRELLSAHRLMDSSELEAPSMRFTKNVMEEIARYHVAPATKTYINKNVIRSIAAFFFTLIAGFTAFCLIQFKWSTQGSDSFKAASPYHLNPAQFSWGRFFNSSYTTIFLLATVVIGLMVLDMYLQRKKQQVNS